MANLFKGVVKLTEAQYETLKNNKVLIVGDTTITFDEHTLYVTDYAIDTELDLNSPNPVENRAIAKALEEKANAGDIPVNVVTTDESQEISGDKNFSGVLKYKTNEVAVKQEIPIVSDDLKTENSANALSVNQGIILNNKITTLVENVNGRVKSFTVNNLEELGILFDVEMTEPLDSYDVTKSTITYKQKEYNLVTGDIFFVVSSDVPDYWFSLDNMKLYKMETMKVDLSNFYTINQTDELLEKKANKASLEETNSKVSSIEKSLETKVEKVNGKQLSSNDYTNEEKEKLSSIEEGAQVNIQSDWNATSGDEFIKNKPTKVSQFENDSKFATEEYVNDNGGKIDKIFLNDVEQEIVDKEVHLTVELPEYEKITDYYKITNKLTGIDLNTIVIPGNYGVANDCTNIPVAENGTLFVGLYQNNQYAQQMFISASNNVYVRTSTSIDNSVWNSWTKLASKEELEDAIENIVTEESDPTVPSYVKTISEEDIDSWNSKVDVNTQGLTYYTLSTGVGSKLDLSIDSSTYTMTLKLTNSEGIALDTKTVDLPLETMVVDASYNKETKEIMLTLQNGSTSSFSVADLVSGLVNTSDLENYVTKDGFSMRASSTVGELYYNTGAGEKSISVKMPTIPDISNLATKDEIPDTSGFAKTSDLENYLPLSGGTLTGPIVISGGDKATGVGNIQFDIDGQITAKGTTKTLFGRNSASSLLLGHGTHSLSIRGTSIEAMASLTTRAIIPVSNNSYFLGNSDKNWKEIYGTTIYQNGKQVANAEDVKVSYTDDIPASGTPDPLASYLPLVAGSGSPITGDLYIKNGTAEKNVYIGNGGQLRVNSGGDIVLSSAAGKGIYLRPQGSNTMTGGIAFTPGAFSPSQTGSNGVSLGTSSLPFVNIYGTTIYQNGVKVATVDDLANFSGGNTITVQDDVLVIE